jgi:Leucine-rich repeat (LRR) protein
MEALPEGRRLLANSEAYTTLEQGAQAAQWLANHPETVVERRSLDLRRKNLTEIPHELPLEHVSRIHLDQNRLPVVPARIFESPDVVQISLWNNVLTELPHFSVEISSLQILNLNNNRLQELPPEIWRLPLRQLLLDNNQLKSIPDDVRFATHLEVLSANDNYLCKVSPRIEELVSLKQLSVCTNRLLSLAVGSMPSLEILAFSGNRFVRVTIGNLPRLREFKASSTGMSEFPVGLRNSVALETISIRNNSFRALPGPDLSSWPNLTSLDVAYNQLQGLPEEMGLVVSLSTLNLLGNAECRLPDSMQRMLSQIPKLTYPSSETAPKQAQNSSFRRVCGRVFSYFSSHQALVL